MIKKIILFFFLLNLFNNSFGSTKVNIINNLKKINSISFDFKQDIEDKNEEGNCIIKYPKKIYCNYKGKKKKTYSIKWKFTCNKKQSNPGIFFISSR